MNNKVMKKRTVEWIWAYLFVAPALFILLAFHLIPAVFSFMMSFTEWNGLTAPRIVGFGNFAALWQDDVFVRSIVNTAYYAVVSVPLSIVLATIVAAIMNQKLRGISGYRLAFFIPVVTMPTAVGLIWKWLLHSGYGPVNYVLGLLHLPQPNWLTDNAFLMPSIIMVAVWSGIGYYMIILLAGLQGISSSYYEAAEIDGASRRRQFFSITLPLLTPSLFFVLLIALINSFQLFDLVFVMTGGENNPVLLRATRSIVYTVYEQGFTRFRMGYASAQAVVLFVVILLFTFIQLALQKRWVHYH